jgi:hypothetical protein
MPLLSADLSSAVRASLRSWLNDEIDDGLAYGWQTRLRRWTVDSFFPPHLREAAMLEECVSDHGHERMTMKALPGSSLKVIKPEFLFQVLMGLFANPSRFDRGSQRA